MQYLTFTELRTKAKKLAKILESGEEVKLIRKSRIIGKVVPEKEEKIKVFNAKRVENIVKKMNLPRLTIKERERRYREAMERKHGIDISRY